MLKVPANDISNDVILLIIYVIAIKPHLCILYGILIYQKGSEKKISYYKWLVLSEQHNNCKI